MMRCSTPSTRFLAIEGGGTKTVALTASSNGAIGDRITTGPLNLKLASDTDVLKRFRSIRDRLGRAPVVGVFLAGCRTASDRQRVERLTCRVFPKCRIVTGNDLDSGMAAAFGLDQSGILVISGTGSVVIGRDQYGQVARAGGWGHVLGDHGSGYWIALTGLRQALRVFDRQGRVSDGLALVLARLCRNHPDELTDWITSAGKDDVASLADCFIPADRGLMLQAASFLAQDAHAVAGKLGLVAPVVVLDGGLLRGVPAFREVVTHRIERMLNGAEARVANRESVEGALVLTQDAVNRAPMAVSTKIDDQREHRDEEWFKLATEQRNPRTMNLDRLTIRQLVKVMLDEESRVIPAIRDQAAVMERVIRCVVAGFRKGGRLFYVGAGTSGRLGVLDASECPPTFSTDPAMVQGIIAGGMRALHSAVEAAEDDPVAGAEAVRMRGVKRHDVVVGITASGRTPFVLGALDAARRRGAKTVLLCFADPGRQPHLKAQIGTGPEVLTGSTRLKAGTATKLVLNLISTVAMIRLGKVVGNLMVDVKPTNAKLRDRARRMVMTLTGCDRQEAQRRLERNGWIVKRALK